MQPISRRRAPARWAGPGQCRRCGRADLEDALRLPDRAAAGIGRAGDVDQHPGSFDGAPRGGRGSGPNRRSASDRVERNGGSPGPTLRLRPGDRLRVQLVNRLAEVTNLHVHGLHVSPERNGDNPFVAVEPGSTFDYDYQLAPTTVGHVLVPPAPHGMVADQIFGGLYGAIIVDEPQGESGSIPITRGNASW